MVKQALLVLMVAPMMTLTTAQAQTGGIQVAPVMVVLRGDDNITSLRIRNGRERPVAFEIDAYAWRQSNGEDVLIPTEELLVAPGVFEIGAESEQIVRLGVAASRSDVERSYRIVMRELPTRRENGNVLGFLLEMSLPVFVAPEGARPDVRTRVAMGDAGRVLLLSNAGNAHVQISSVEDMDAGALDAPRYLLPGASAEIILPRTARTIRVRAAESNGSQTERLVHVEHSDNRASLR
jgi:fimbrial chaperone protein